MFHNSFFHLALNSMPFKDHVKDINHVYVVSLRLEHDLGVTEPMDEYDAAMVFGREF